jgi:DNA polymerase delta subunit 1
MVHFQAVAWDGQDQDDQFTIRIFGRAEDGRSVSLGTKFNPYCFVKTDKDLKSFIKSTFWRGLVSCEVHRAKDLWGFQNGDISRFLKLEFKTHRALRNFAYCVENNKHAELFGCRMYESNIDPVLRFMHVSGCTSTGWIDPGLCEPDAESTCEVNLWAPNWRFITPLDRDGLAPLRIMSFDIECYSSTGAFPDPKNPRDVVFQIGMTTKEFGREGYLDRKCLCLKQTAGPDVECFETEKELLQAFERYLVKMDPDIITGWNIFGFDLEFLIVRATIHCGLSPVWGRIRGEVATLVEKNLSSSALGNNELKMVPMKGRYVFDLFQDIKREHKLESYSLNNVSKHFLKDQKHDMPVKEIFSRFAEGDPVRLGEVAEYCIKDTELPHAIMAKVCQIQNVVEMAKACWVPLAFLSERGQQIKVFSQMAKKARELNFVIPTFKRTNGTDPNGSGDGYQGATVLEAQTGAYYGPITALDFASLYPSIMCAENLCYSTLVMDPKYDNLPGVTYEQFGPHKFAQTDADGKLICSLLPTILMDLKAYRKKAKKLMAAAEGTPMEAVYNGQQLAYKISMNSIYGFTGASKGMLPCVAIASTVTMRGRQMIEETKNYVEKNFQGAKVRYGDSVMPGTPVLVRQNLVTSVRTIESLGDAWNEYPGFLRDGTDKEQCEVTGLEAWTHDGWQPIKRVIRHKCQKKIFRVLTHTGCVDVTEDHSLLGPDLKLLKPKDVNVGQALYHAFPKPLNKNEDLQDPTKITYMFSNHLDAQNKFLELRNLGYLVSITSASREFIQFGVFKEGPRSKYRKDPSVIKKVDLLHDSWDGYVYDLETEAGTFQAGVGQMIVKNTDSVMVEFDVQGRKGQEAIDYSWQLGEQASEQCSKLFKAPNDLELEKVFCPWIIYSKKRYAGKMYEGKTNKDGKPILKEDGTQLVGFKKIDIKGLQVVRRDSCPYVRETLEKLLEMVLESSDPNPVIVAAREAARNLIQGKVPMEKLLMSKQLAAEYKVPTPHVTVRDKIRARAPGSEPQQGDRVPFVIVKGGGKMFEKAEDPAWVREKGTPLDYQYYFTNQFKKPVQDLLEPLVSADVIFDKKFMAKTESTTEVEARKAFLAMFSKKAT